MPNHPFLFGNRAFRVALICLAAIPLAHAQVITTGLPINGPQHAQKLSADKARMSRDYLQKSTKSDTLAVLPFMDDFTRADLSWAPSPYYFAQSINHLHFFSPTTGRGFGAQGTLVATTDQGKTWSRLAQSLSAPDILSVSFPENNSNGWACGNKGWLAKTADAGNTWAPLSLPTNAAQTLVSIAFKNLNEGLLADSAGALFYTDNGGQTWLHVPIPNFKGATVNWQPDGSAIAGGDSARIATSATGGQGWAVTDLHPRRNQTIRKIRFFDANTGPMGMAMGDSGLMYRRPSGLSTWYKAWSASVVDLLDVDFAENNNKIGWAVGRGGGLLASQDGGNSWTQIPSGTTDDLKCVVLINELRGWIGSSNGRIIQVVYDPLKPESTLWERNSGVFINNTFATDPISMGVATFDGLNAAGIPYSQTINKTGPCDTLTSTHINLQGVANTIYVSFYWQPCGKAVQVLPDHIDSLVLQFKSPGDNWISVWARPGVDSEVSPPFRFSSILITDSLKYNGFQFRFVNYGIQNGNYDVWNLDYVRLDNAHSPVDSSAFDLALTNLPSRLLKDYHAYPLDQFNALLAGGSLFSVAVGGEVINMNKAGLLNNVTGKFRIVDERLNSVVKELSSAEVDGFGLVPTNNGRRDLSVAKNSLLQDWAVSSIPMWTTLKYGFFLDKDDIYNPYTSNDTLFSRLNLSTYMAYDDGSAELVRFVSGSAAKGAVRFFLPATDTITDIQLVFPRSPYTEVQTINFTLILYRDIDVDANTDQPIFRLPVSLVTSDSVNKVNVFSLRIRPLAQRILEGNKHFYIGWEQGAIDNGNEVRLGVDINSTHPDTNTFVYKSGASWVRYLFDRFPIMIRPVFGVESPTGVQNRISAPRSPFFPNPSSGKIHNREAFHNLHIFNTLGQEVTVKPSTETHLEVDLDVPAGLYTLQWQETDGQWVGQRMMVHGK